MKGQKTDGKYLKRVKIQKYGFNLFIVQFDNKKHIIDPLWFFSKVYEKKVIDIE